MLRNVRLREPIEVGPGIYMLGTKWVNFYLVTDGDEAILVDAGYSRYDPQLAQLLAALGIAIGAISAVFVTHHHVDHVGTAELARSNGAQVFVHENDAAKVSGRTVSHPPSGFFRQSWRPTMVRYLLHTALAGGASYTAVQQVEVAGGEQTFDLPGQPRVAPTRGRTHGHFSVHIPDRGVLFTGGALVNFDYATGERGPKLHRFNEDRATARASLDVLASLDAEVLLFGHGDPWTSGTDSAIDHARRRDSKGT